VASEPKPNNPFYAILLVVGVLFVLTACTYFVMTLQDREESLGGNLSPSRSRFIAVVDRYGFTALMVELGVLALATFAAIGTDDYWTRRAARARADDELFGEAVRDRQD